ncbi:MAG TPA: N-acetylmuramoyl-L-alanine amidase [Acidocella sp.]|jgi:N-acetylmuramoyl-L-alanine amidase|uniref:N-acetylmuramoyl-L-alanine amidase family protein n=1 Tax=Acidocella sp. TaxID=50710 RepID=UPI002C8699CE|nr:N-acetylmuramoyl-L-alanine amidase [Acidocella sp.]HVE21815.1 N-acetylmuramoyl-L-alanine amidase [Acidocella sp.]
MCEICFVGRRKFSGLALGLAATGLIATGLPALARSRSVRKSLPLIMLDPGHGGNDPGAIAADGLFEKTITLATGHLLYRTLSRTGRYRVEMTRSTDVYVTLEGRVADAVAAKADLFLSLHCDHLPEADLSGASVFTLSSKASDRLAADVATDENSADRFAGPHFAGVSPQVASILASLETRATRIGSATLASDIQRSFTGVVPLLPDPHRSANLAVLRDPSVPSALLEMGCLSNPLDERLLKSASHRQLIADRLTSSIDAYFTHYSGGRGVRMAG